MAVKPDQFTIEAQDAWVKAHPGKPLDYEEIAKYRQATETAHRVWDKVNPGKTATPAQMDELRQDALKEMDGGLSLRNGVATGMTATAYGLDGMTMYNIGAKNGFSPSNYITMSQTYGNELSANAKSIAAAGRNIGASGGILNAAGRSAAWSMAGETVQLAGKIATPLTAATGVVMTGVYAYQGDCRAAYKTSYSVGTSLSAAVVAGAAGGSIFPGWGNVIGAGVGIIGYYGGEWLGDKMADWNCRTATSAAYDPNTFKNAPATQTAFTGAVSPVAPPVTQVAKPDTVASNEQKFQNAPKPAISYVYK